VMRKRRCKARAHRPRCAYIDITHHGRRRHVHVQEKA
jgi:hypothetical protein